MPKVINTEDPPKTTRATRASSGGTGATPTSTGSAVRRSPADRKLAEDLSGFYQTAGVVLLGLGIRLDDGGLAGSGAATVEKADELAEAWLAYADKNPKIKQALKRLTEATALGTLISIHGVILIPFLTSRGIIPASVAAAAGAAVPVDPSVAANGESA